MIDFPRLVAQETGWSSVSRRTSPAAPERIAVPFAVDRELSPKEGSKSLQKKLLRDTSHLEKIDSFLSEHFAT